MTLIREEAFIVFGKRWSLSPIEEDTPIGPAIDFVFGTFMDAPFIRDSNCEALTYRIVADM